MKKSLLIVAALVASPAAFAEDTYICDGFKIELPSQKLSKIPNSKFEIKHSSLGLEIENKATGKEWHAYEEIGQGLYKNGNVLLQIFTHKDDGKIKFKYKNTENGQLIGFDNCVVPNDF